MTEAERLHKAQIEKAIEIAGKDLSAISPTDMLRLRLDLQEFLHSGGVGGLMIPTEMPDDSVGKLIVPTASVGKMIEGLREVLRWLTVVHFPEISTDPDKSGVISVRETVSPVTFQLRTNDASEPFRFSLVMEPNAESAKAILLYHLGHSHLSPDRIQLCSRRECEKIFVLGVHADPNRKRYCSPECSQAVALKAYRDRKKEKAKRKKQKQRRKK